ncbi:MAG: hypothetical protein Q8P18_05395 [Pseudomonadota bacterium]|nr:hypothetical protein [Pseudomonadota bacterium]
MHTPDESLAITLATFLFLVRRAGHALKDPAVESACAAFTVASGAGGAPVETLGKALVDAVRVHLTGARVEDVVTALGALLGGDHVFTDLGEAPERESRTAAIRRAHFGNPLPWLAVIIDRQPDGEVGRHWVMVEAFDDAARVMDPNPWDDKDEERSLPIGDFMVQWELAGCRSVRVH